MADEQEQAPLNPVAQAVVKLGGMTRAIVKTGISEATWQRWRREGRIADPDAIFFVADLTGISARALASYTPPTRGPGEPQIVTSDTYTPATTRTQAAETPGLAAPTARLRTRDLAPPARARTGVRSKRGGAGISRCNPQWQRAGTHAADALHRMPSHRVQAV